MGGAGSGTVGGAGRGDIGAGLQIEDTGVAPEAALLLIPSPPRFEFEEDEEEEDEDELVLDTAGGLNWPLLSEPGLSRDGEAFFFAGRILALLPLLLLLLLCCCCLHLALRFLNQTWTGREKRTPVHKKTTSTGVQGA